jgi:hypothetical protein
MTKGYVFLVGAASFFAGLALGFMASPVKNGIGNNSGNQTHYHYGEKINMAKEPENECCCSEENEETEDGAAGDSAPF